MAHAISVQYFVNSRARLRVKLLYIFVNFRLTVYNCFGVNWVQIAE